MGKGFIRRSCLEKKADNARYDGRQTQLSLSSSFFVFLCLGELNSIARASCFFLFDFYEI